MRRFLSALLAALTLLPTLAHSQKRPMSDKDLFDFHWIGDTQIAPNGKSLLYVECTVTPDHSTYQTSIYWLDLASPNATPQLLTPGTHDSSPRWSPDGTQIAFTRSAERPAGAAPGGGGGGAQVYLMPAQVNGTVIKISELPRGAGDPQWTPDGKALVVSSSTPQDQAAARIAAAKLGRATGDAAHVSDIKIIDRSNYRSNGVGLLDPTNVGQLYMIYLPKPDGTQDPAWQLTAGRFSAGEPILSSNGWLFFTSTHIDEPVYEEFPHSTLYGFKLPTGAHPRDVPTVTFTHDMGLGARGIAFSPDNKHLAFHASIESKTPATHRQTDLWTVDLAWSGDTPSITATPKNLTGSLAYEMGGAIGGDNTAPRGGGRGGILWNSDSTHLTDVVATRGSALLVSVDTSTGKLTELTAHKQAVLGFVTTPDAGATIALISNPILIGDLFTIGPNQTQTQLTHSNDKLFSQLDISMPLDIQVKPTHHAEDVKGETIDTFLMLPPGVTGKPASPLPFILNIHGGPHSAYGWVFDHEMLYMAGLGYVVDYPNPRGSTTYGANFANIIMNNYPGDDFHDLMDTVDEAIKLGYADPSRLGVTGGSGGGLLTDWIVTQTDRFKAAVAQRDITDWAGWWYTTDGVGFHQSFYPKGAPWENPKGFAEHSPVTYVANLKTPMMFILGEADYRTPPTSGGEVFFRALKYKKIPTVMVRFPRESHELSRSGEPWHRIERLENITNWFDRFLLNKCEPQYDIVPTCTVAN
jgi:dipeptidyl aminopeptidase/acylaminoacyl peptidase